MYIFAKINQENFDGVEFANNLLEKGLAVAPGKDLEIIRISLEYQYAKRRKH